MTAIPTLMWFRQDLRLQDNPALSYAIAQGDILPIYILDTQNSGKWGLGGASKWWLHQSLSSLNESLNGKLQFFQGCPLELIPDILEKTGITSIVWNRCYEPWQIKRDKKLKRLLQEKDINVQSFNGSLLWEPWEVLKKDGTPYKVFTPYYRKGCLPSGAPRKPEKTKSKYNLVSADIGALVLEDLNLMPDIQWYEHMAKEWQPGEQGASKHLKRFLKKAVTQYKTDRDIPSLTGTSRLSPHLHFGEISPNQIWYAALAALAPDIENKDLDCYLSELGWREFSYYLLFHFPTLPEKNFQPKFDHFPWAQNKKALKAWQKGQTGIPIVDAGMRELWQTGYMHNRVRMIVGSFLVKNLLLHWSHGEKWFWDCLLDADLASNSASWQWVAGSGADAAPYFRIFNPVSQGERFDPDGRYVRKYCPELKDVPNKFIHQPWEAEPVLLKDANVTLGKDYPKPLVDLKTSRQRALDAFSGLKGL